MIQGIAAIVYLAYLATVWLPRLLKFRLVAFWMFQLKSGLLLAGFVYLVNGPGLLVRMLALAAMACAMPGLLLQAVLVPRGWHRGAYWVARLGFPLTVANDNLGGAVLYGALALARKGAPPEARQWLEHKLDKAHRVRGTGMVAAGLLAACAGDRDAARRQLRLADGLPHWAMTLKGRVLARDWLAADAAARADWHEAIRLGRRGRWNLRWSYLLARIGERLLQRPRAWRDWQLWPLWLLAPRRRATRPLLHAALAVPRRRAPPASLPPSADLPSALARLTGLLRDSARLDSATLAQALRAVDQQLDAPGTLAALDARLQTLGAQAAAGAVVQRLRAGLVEQLTPMLEAAPHLGREAQQAATLAQAFDAVRSKLFREVETRCADYEARTRGEYTLTIAAELESWAACRDAADRLLELDPGARVSLFQACFAPLCNFGAYQHNKIGQHTYAYAIFDWLLAHAGNDADARKRLAENVAVARTSFFKL